MNEKHIEDTFRKDIQPLMPVMFQKARFKQKIVKLDQQQTKIARFNKRGQIFPYYKPILKPNVRP